MPISDAYKGSSARLARGKKPWYRTRNIILALFAIGLCWLGYRIHWAYTAKPGLNHTFYPEMLKIRDRYLPDDWRVEGEHPEGENASVLIQQLSIDLAGIEADLIDAVDTLPRDQKRIIEAYAQSGGVRISMYYEEAAPPEVKSFAVKGLLQAEEDGFPDILDTIAQTRVWERDPGGGSAIMMTLPDLGPSRNLARYCAARMMYMIEQGNEAEAIRSYGHAMAIAQDLTYQTTLIDRLVGIAIASLMNTQLTYALSEHQFSEQSLQRLAEITESRSVFPPVALQFECERVGSLDFLESIYTDDGNGDGTLLFAEFNTLWGGLTITPAPPIFTNDIMNIAGLAMPTKKEVAASMNAYYDDLLAALELDRDGQDLRLSELEFRVGTGNVDPISRVLLPAVSRVATTDQDCRDGFKALRLLLALHRQTAREGVPPDELADLDPALIEGPEVLLNPLTGEPWPYTRVEPTPDDPRAFLLGVSKADLEKNGAAGTSALNALRPLPIAESTEEDSADPDDDHEGDE